MNGATFLKHAGQVGSHLLGSVFFGGSGYYAGRYYAKFHNLDHTFCAKAFAIVGAIWPLLSIYPSLHIKSKEKKYTYRAYSGLAISAAFIGTCKYYNVFGTIGTVVSAVGALSVFGINLKWAKDAQKKPKDAASQP